MTTEPRYERVTTPDGDAFDAYCAAPPSRSGPGILRFQEIFGINDNMRGPADKLAAEGYLVVVPDVFWRIERRFERKDESGFGDAIAMAQKLDLETTAGDIAAAHAHILQMPEHWHGGCSGLLPRRHPCLHGRRSEPRRWAGDDAAVSYYGSGNDDDLLSLLPAVECPLVFHYGSQDPFIPEERIAEVEVAVADRPDITVHRCAAGHAFSNWDAPYRPA